ncbi:orotidine-5'-phosphate decarboxylase [Pyrodictium delaneyi]|nr:orotidine-5'-phosphate decarboxylase [Pyrodictium delaneyi]OWJ54152.1 orotidine-5'-phosphate decarboxylase [Pyrodictium delaneyi]
MSLIVALDSPDREFGSLVEDLCDIVDGFKLGLPLLMGRGVDYAARLRSRCNRGLWIADLKLADIGHVMKLTTSLVVEHVDAVIAHGFVGIQGALGELKEFLNSLGKKLVVVASMSHPGAREVYDKALPLILNVIGELEPWGIVAPATRPQVITSIRERLGDSVTILSPGVGAQGAEPGAAICAGADYEIVGRLITSSNDPRAAALAVKDAQKQRLQACKRGA